MMYCTVRWSDVVVGQSTWIERVCWWCSLGGGGGGVVVVVVVVVVGSSERLGAASSCSGRATEGGPRVR